MKVINFLLGLIVCFSVNSAYASSCSDNEMRFNYAAVGTPVSLVVPNSLAFNVTVNGSLKSGGDWDSTSVEIVGFNEICFNHSGSSVAGSSWVDRVNTFSLTAPFVTGIYDMLITMHKGSGCNGCNKQKTITFGVGTLATGPQGPTGSDGLPGEPGQDGDDGQDGEDGLDGQDGSDGEDGLDGTSGTDGQDGTNGIDGTSCTVVENEDGSATVTCGEESVTIQPGQNGLPGENGLDCFDLNANGQGDLCDPLALEEFENCASFREYCLSGANDEDFNIDETNAKIIRASKQIFDCGFTEDTNGDESMDTLDCLGQQGLPGNQGSQGSGGVNGTNGSPGSSCRVSNNNGTYTMSCDDGSYVTWQDGQDGVDGIDGQNGDSGVDGQQGLHGNDGNDGKPCFLVNNDDRSTTITCGNISFIIEGEEDVVTPPKKGGICGSIDIVTLLLGLAVGAGAGFIRKK